MKKSNNKETEKNSNLNNIPTIDKNSFVPSNYLQNAIKNLLNPRFLGSIHLKNNPTQSDNSINNLIDKNVATKVNKSLKNTLFNPLTKILIISFIVFNLIWFLLIYIL
jgi:hypothetical protein